MTKELVKKKYVVFLFLLFYYQQQIEFNKYTFYNVITDYVVEKYNPMVSQ